MRFRRWKGRAVPMYAQRNNRGCGERRHLTATVLGKFAASVLRQNSEFEVAALFERSFYLSSGNSTICVGEESLGAGPLNVLVARDAADTPVVAGIRQGKDVRVFTRAAEPRMGKGLVIDDSTAGVWSPPAWPEFSPETGVTGRVQLAREEMVRIAPATGMNVLHGGCNRRQEKQSVAAATERAFRQLAGPAVLAFKHWLRQVCRKDAAVPPPPADMLNLIGLGPGLTPSGDDFLGGSLITLRALGYDRAADELASAVIGAGETRTHTISLQHLQCAGQGEGHETLHAFLIGLLAADTEEVEPALTRLGQLGHSSGWDMACGALTVLEVALETTAG